MSPGRPLVVRAPADLDASTAPAFRDELGLLVATGVATIVVDMSDVVFLDSSGMGALVAVQQLASRLNVTLALRELRPNVAATLRIAGLTESLHASTAPSADQGPGS